MKAMIILTVVGLLIGMAGAVGIVVVREKQARADAVHLVADSAAAHADSLHADSAHLGEAHADTAQGDSTHLAHADSAGPPLPLGHDSASALLAGGRPGGEPDSVTRQVLAASSPAGPDEQRLARIFAAMRPEQAARVLEQMTDPEVRLLLSHLRERQAAAIMSSITPERAAVISSAVIRGERSTP